MSALPTTQATSWVSATYAILTVMTRKNPRHDLFGGAQKTPETTGVTKKILANSWGVENREQALQTLTDLRDKGDRGDRDPNAADGLGPRGLLAWDLIRLNAVAGWSYVAEYITEGEAYEFALPASKQLQQAYQSWEDLEEAYVKGIFAWHPDAGPQGEDFRGKIANEPSSPWKVVPWNTPLELAQGGGAALVGGSPFTGGATTGMPRLAGGIGRYVVGAVVVAALAAAGIFGKGAIRGGGSKSSSWDGRSPYKCGGNDSVVLTNVVARLDGRTAVTAGGNCHLTLKNPTLQGTIAIVAGGNATVDVEGGSISGSTNAVEAGGNAHVELHGTKVTGALHKSANGQVTGP